MSEMNLEEKLCKNLEESCIKAYKAGQQSQQAEIDRLNSVLDERTKEWLQAIECGAYFENVAKPLKEENDRLKAQLNNMETCYIEKKKQVEAVEYVLGCAMIGPKEVFQYADTIGKALRGEHD